MEKAQTAREDAGETALAAVNESKVEPVDVIGGDEKGGFGAEKLNGATPAGSSLPGGAAGPGQKVSLEAQAKKSGGKRSGLLGKFKSTKKSEKTFSEDFFSFENEAAENIEQRPAFSTGHNSRTSKKTRPREVAVPYSKLRKDRFFDWPPDPTVSRATPISGPWLAQPATDLAEQDLAGNGMPGQDLNPQSPTGQPIPKAANGLSSDLEHLRRRYVSEQQAEGGASKQDGW